MILYGGWRDLIRAQEKKRPSVEKGIEPGYTEDIHEIARHTIHSSETLAMALIVVDCMLAELGKPDDDSTARKIGC